MTYGFFSVYVFKAVYLIVLHSCIWMAWVILLVDSFFSFHFLMDKWYKLLRAGVFAGHRKQSETYFKYVALNIWFITWKTQSDCRDMCRYREGRRGWLVMNLLRQPLLSFLVTKLTSVCAKANVLRWVPMAGPWKWRQRRPGHAFDREAPTSHPPLFWGSGHGA